MDLELGRWAGEGMLRGMDQGAFKGMMARFEARWGWLVSVAVGLLLTGPAMGQADPPGQTQFHRVVEAHRAVQAVVLEVRFATYYCYPDETEFIDTGYRVALDRPGKRLRIDRPGYTLICDGVDILLVADALPGRHLRIPLSGPLTYERLVEVFPDLADPTAPGLIMLLSDDPVAVLSDGQVQDTTTLGAPNVAGRPLLRFGLPMQLGRCELTCDGKTQLLDQALMEVDSKRLANAPVDAVRFHYALVWNDINQSVDDALFKLDLKRSQEMTTLAQFLSTGSGVPRGPRGAGGGGAPGGGGAAPAATLVGLPLPDVELALLGSDKKVNLADIEEGVAIVEFYASWTKASTLDLPALTAFRAWCEANDHEVAIYGVAVGETDASMGKWMVALERTAKKKITVPILLDPTTDAAMAMKLPTVPRTIIAVDGRVVDVFGGVKPKFLKDLKQGFPKWQEKVKVQTTESEPKPEPASEEGQHLDEGPVESNMDD